MCHGHGQILGNTPGIVRDLFHAWTTVIPLERWGQTAASGAGLFLWGYLYTIVGVFSFQNKTRFGVVLARDRSRWSTYEVTGDRLQGKGIGRHPLNCARRCRATRQPHRGFEDPKMSVRLASGKLSGSK